ncbi:MAG: SH3 domain-containing protein [Anaerolineae bacterium]
MFRVLRLLILLLVVFLTGTLAAAQEVATECPQLVQTAVQAVGDHCAALGRNQACYGNLTLQVEPLNDESLEFDSPGDIISVTRIRNLTLSQLNETVPEWGVALMQLQANLPDTLPGQNVTVVLFGETRLEAVPTPLQLTVTVSAQNDINVRREPSQQAEVLTTLASGSQITASGRSAEGDWLRLALPDGAIGWAAAFLFSSDADLNTLSVVGTDSPVSYAPMQAFYFSSGLGSAPCVEAPQNGMLIQTPQGASTVTLYINGVTIALGSTAFIQGRIPGVMRVQIIEGAAEVTALGETLSVPAGTKALINLDASGNPAGAPVGPFPYEASDWGTLPLALLPRAIEIAAPQDAPCLITAATAVNTRSGPGTNYPLAEGMVAEETVNAIGRAYGSDTYIWWELAEGRWVRSDVVEDQGSCMTLPLETDIPAAPTSSGGGTGGGAGGGSLEIGMSSFGTGTCSPSDIAYGTELTIEFGAHYSWTTEQEARDAAAAPVWGMAVNGQGLPLLYTETLPNPGGTGYLNIFHFQWGTPDPGVYSLQNTEPVGNQYCTVTITP